MHSDRINFLEVGFDQLSFEEMKYRLRETTNGSPFTFIVTPNVDHVVRLHREPQLRSLYQAADVCLCDSRVLRLLAKSRGIQLPLVPGSDLTEAIFSELIRPGDRIVIIGSDRRAIDQLRANFPQVDVLHFSAPPGLRTNSEARSEAASFAADANARFAFIAVGSPQQEMIAREIAEHPQARGVALCIGAGLDFVLGNQKRAPRWVQALGLEWAHRLATNPRRLWRRYLVDGLRIFPIYFRWRKRGQSRNWPILIASGLLLLLLLAAVTQLISHTGPQPVARSVRLAPAASSSVAAIRALPPPDLLKPLSPQQAAVENAERPFTARPDNPSGHFVLRTDAEDASRALDCLAQAVYYEAGGEGVDGGRAVAQVVLNRLRHPGFPSTVCGVVYQGSERPTGCQFSFTCNGSLQHQPVPWLWTRSREIAEQALHGQVFAPVGHATHYHADYVLPYWADSLDKSVQIGRHIFYRLRGAVGGASSFSQHYSGSETAVVQPATTTIIAQTPDAQQLAQKLIVDNASVAQKDSAQGAANPLLLADSHAGTLVADPGNAVAPPSRPTAHDPCATVNQAKPSSSLRADDVRPLPSATACPTP